MLRVREICKERNISQKELAERLGTSPSALLQSINGNPTIDRVIQMAEILNVSVAELIGEVKTTGLTCPKCGAKLKLVEE